MPEEHDLEKDVASLKEELRRRDEEQIAKLHYKHEQRAGCATAFLAIGGPVIIIALILQKAPEVFDNPVGQWFLIIAAIVICLKVWGLMQRQRDREISEAERKKFRG